MADRGGYYMADRGGYLFMLLMVVIVLLALFRGVLVSQDEAVRALENYGFTDVLVTDKDVFLVGLRGCGKGDAAGFDALAINPQGSRVVMLVCVGWPFKGATVRVK